jgi:hypothetical protein
MEQHIQQLQSLVQNRYMSPGYDAAGNGYGSGSLDDRLPSGAIPSACGWVPKKSGETKRSGARGGKLSTKTHVVADALVTPFTARSLVAGREYYSRTGIPDLL